MSDTEATSIWGDDKLGFEAVAGTFAQLIASIDDTKVISIEAGYGRGKSFFRERWAKHLKNEVVVQVDAHMADHSGDPVVTFLGAMIASLPEVDTSKRKVAFEKGKKIVGVLARTAGGIAPRLGAEALVDCMAELVSNQAKGSADLQQHIERIGDGVSKRAGDLLAAQIEAERVREVDLPAQLRALRDALTEGAAHKRIVVLVDELDRCHPDYAIAFLEAMKLVFAEEGFVFCLFVNADYLEGLAQHRFGIPAMGERYLDKFIDIRLALPWTDAALSHATEHVFKQLPEGTPFGEGQEFTIARAAKLAADLAPLSGLSMRQIERVKLKVELAIRGYSDAPLDYALLVWLAFEQAIPEEQRQKTASERGGLLPRSNLTSSIAEKISSGAWPIVGSDENRAAQQFLHAHCKELVDLPKARYVDEKGRSYPGWHHVCALLAQDYIPEHEAVLNASQVFAVSDSSAPED